MRNRLYFVRLPPSKRTLRPFGSRTVFASTRRFQQRQRFRRRETSPRGCSIGQTFGKGSSWIPSLPLSGIYMSPGYQTKKDAEATKSTQNDKLSNEKNHGPWLLVGYIRDYDLFSWLKLYTLQSLISLKPRQNKKPKRFLR